MLCESDCGRHLRELSHLQVQEKCLEQVYVSVQKYQPSYAVLWTAEFGFESLRSEHSSLKLEFLLYPSADRGLVPLQ